jgi:hypothetical protein
LSIKVIQWVWDCSQSKNAERLVLLAIADNAADDGTRAYPSVVEIARKANLSERGVQAAVARLVTSGELSVKVGGGRGRVNMYTVIMRPCGRTPQNLHPSAPAADEETPQNDAETPQNDAVNPAESAPGTVLEPSKEPSTSSCDADASPPNAGLILKGFIDYLKPNVTLTKRVIGHLAKEIKALLDEGFDDPTIRRALALMAENGQAGHPAQLPNYVVKVQNTRRVSPPAPQFKNSEEQAIERKRIRMARAKMMDALMAAGATFDEAKERVAGVPDSELLNDLYPSSALGYIDGDVIDEVRPEVES